jgi:hypothetical protein
MIETKNYKVEQTKKFHYKLHAKTKGEEAYSLVLCIMKTKLIPGAIYNDNDDSISFVAERVNTLEDFLKVPMSQNQCVKMIYCITKQLEELEKCAKKLGFYGIDLNEILVINEEIFIIASSAYLRHILNERFFFYSPFHLPLFSSPELLSIKSLPADIHYKCFYYSLGGLCMHCLFSEEKEHSLETISYTKMYWFLKRCFAEDPEKRSLLFL